MRKIKTLVKSAVMLFKSEKKIPIPTPVSTEELLKGKVALITGGSGTITQMNGRFSFMKQKGDRL